MAYAHHLFVAGLVCTACALPIVTTPRRAHAMDPSFKGKVPIEWVHVAKSGTSFLQNLLHIEGVCPGLPPNFQISADELNMFITPRNMPWRPSDEDLLSVPVNPRWKCDASLVDVAWGRLEHAGIESLPNGGFNAGKGHFMMLMRQPEQRLLSFWHAKTKDLEYFDLDTVIANQSGMMAKMLTRAGPARFMYPAPTDTEIKEAKSRLHTGFSFIGLTEQWDLSICLFNVMFNQQCRSYQFSNSRPTSGSKSTLYDLVELKGYHDPYDKDLYDIGVQRYKADLKKYNVSAASCESCWRDAGVL